MRTGSMCELKGKKVNKQTKQAMSFELHYKEVSTVIIELQYLRKEETFKVKWYSRNERTRVLREPVVQPPTQCRNLCIVMIFDLHEQSG